MSTNYNVAATFVGIVKAANPDEALRAFVGIVEDRTGFSHHDDDTCSPPFESEEDDS